MITAASRKCFTKIGHSIVKVAKKVLLMGRFVHDCPLLARKLESGLETKTPRKSKNYKGIMWWPGTELNRRNLSRRRGTRSVGEPPTRGLSVPIHPLYREGLQDSSAA